MKLVLFVIACLLAAVLAAPLQDSDYNYLFALYAKQYNKQYRSNDVFNRLKIFRSNLDRIIEHNAKNLDYKLGVNQFADLTNNEFKKFLGLKPLPRQNLHATRQLPDGMIKANPIDWEKEGRVNAVKDQGQCGSCWAFSTVGAAETAYAIKTGQLELFSEQQLVDCDKDSGNEGCNGGFMITAFESFYEKGHPIVTAASYPYTARDGTCKEDQAVKIAKVTDHVVLEATNDAHIEALQKSAVAVGIAASSFDFQLYSSGVLTHCPDQELNHGVVIIGYGEESGIPYYKIRNSWGKSWGEHGNIKIAVSDKKLCGVASQPETDVYPIVQPL